MPSSFPTTLRSFSGKFDGLLNVNYNFLGLDLTVMPGDVWKDFFTGGWPVIGVVLIPFISGALSFLQSKVVHGRQRRR